MDSLGILIGVAGLVVGLIGSITGLISVVFAVESNKKLEALRVDYSDLATSYKVIRGAVLEEAKREGKTVQAELKDAFELGDKAVVRVIPASKMEFTGHPRGQAVGRPGRYRLKYPNRQATRSGRSAPH